VRHRTSGFGTGGHEQKNILDKTAQHGKRRLMAKEKEEGAIGAHGSGQLVTTGETGERRRTKGVRGLGEMQRRGWTVDCTSRPEMDEERV